MKYVYVFSDFETTGIFDFKKPNEIIYPIEVGLIFTDENYAIYDTYESLIGWEELIMQIQDSKYEWPDFAKDAYNIHKIKINEYLLYAKLYTKVAGDIYKKISNIKNKINNKKIRFVLISDNIQFEFRLMEFLLRDYAIEKDYDWPFHYCGYDSSELLIKTGVGDPIPEHRALRDAAILHQHMIRSLERINNDLRKERKNG